MSPRGSRESVPGMSRLQYVMGVLEDHGHKVEVTFDEIFQTVKKIGFQIEYERIKMSGLHKDLTKEEIKEKYEKQLKNLTRRDLIRLLKRWNILEPSDLLNHYRFVESSKNCISKILLAKKEGDENKQWLYLYSLALISGEFFIFPGKYSLTLRSSNTGSLYFEELQGRLGNVTIKRPINPTSTRVITDWMELFGFSAKFPTVKPDGKESELIISTKAVATLKEVTELKIFLEKRQSDQLIDILKEFATDKHLSPFEAKSLYQCVLKTGIIKTNNSLVSESKIGDILLQAIKNGVLVVTEEGNVAKIIERPEEVPPDTTFLITDFQLSLENFYEVLYEKMLKLRKTSYDYVWISDLKREVCKETHIHPRTFDKLLKEIFRKYGPDVIEVTGVYAATFSRKRIKEIPLNIDGRPIYKIRLKREKL